MARKIDGYCQSHDNQEYLDRGNTVYVNRTPCTGKDPRCTVVVHSGKTERVFTESEIKQLVKALRMAWGLIDKLNDEGFGPLTSKEGLDTFNALNDALDVFDPA